MALFGLGGIKLVEPRKTDEASLVQAAQEGQLTAGTTDSKTLPGVPVNPELAAAVAGEHPSAAGETPAFDPNAAPAVPAANLDTTPGASLGMPPVPKPLDAVQSGPVVAPAIDHGNIMTAEGLAAQMKADGPNPSKTTEILVSAEDPDVVPSSELEEDLTEVTSPGAIDKEAPEGVPVEISVSNSTPAAAEAPAAEATPAPSAEVHDSTFWNADAPKEPAAPSEVPPVVEPVTEEKTPAEPIPAADTSVSVEPVVAPVLESGDAAVSADTAPAAEEDPKLTLPEAHATDESVIISSPDAITQVPTELTAEEKERSMQKHHEAQVENTKQVLKDLETRKVEGQKELDAVTAKITYIKMTVLPTQEANLKKITESYDIVAQAIKDRERMVAEMEAEAAKIGAEIPAAETLGTKVESGGESIAA